MQYDQEWQAFCAWLGIKRQRKAKIPKESTGESITYCVISDPHIPFHDRDAMAEAIEWAKGNKASRLIVAGDSLDCYSLSRFVQYERIPIQEEFITARTVFDYWSRTFTSIWVCEGNHEARERKHLAGQLTPDLYQWFYSGSILERLTADMPNVSLVRRTICGHTLYWIAQIGQDAVVGHPEKFSSIPMRPVENFARWLTAWHDVIKITQPRLILSGHTHQAGIIAGHEVIVETGCLCQTQGYTLEPRLYSKPQRHAATIFTQVNGRTDLNSLRQYYPGVNDEVKPLAPDIR